MLHVRQAALLLAFVLASALWPAGFVRAEETWIIEIQRYLEDPGTCAPEDEADVYTRRSEPGPVRNTRLVAPQLSPAAVEPAHGISCIQGTRIARAQGFDHVEVVSCDDEEYYVYEALRGRIPWRMVVSRFEALIVHAAPLD